MISIIVPGSTELQFKHWDVICHYVQWLYLKGKTQYLLGYSVTPSADMLTSTRILPSMQQERFCYYNPLGILTDLKRTPGSNG